MTKLNKGHNHIFIMCLAVAVVVFLSLCEYVFLYFGITEFWVSLFDVLVVSGAIHFALVKLKIGSN